MKGEATIAAAVRLRIVTPRKVGVVGKVTSLVEARRDQIASNAQAYARGKPQTESTAVSVMDEDEEPISPLAAASGPDWSSQMQDAISQSAQVEQDADVVLVEGAGGLLVPIDLRVSYLDLFARWRTPLLLVAGNKLGVLNHVLLTVRATEAAGVPVRAIVLTALSDRDATVAEATNFDALVTLLPHLTILRFPWVDRPDDLDALATAAEVGGLDVLLSPSSP